MESSNLIRVIIVDDQPTIRNDVELLLKSYPEFALVGSYATVREAVRTIPLVKPDVLILDISLGDGTGFDILEHLLDTRLRIIFLTAYEEYALKAIKVGAIDYLIKPINETEFRTALGKVVQSIGKKSQFSPRILLPLENQHQVVDIDDIVYCQSDTGYTTFFLSNNDSIKTSKHIGAFEHHFTIDKFVRPHQSFIVNLKFVHRIHNDGYLILKNGSHIPVSTRREKYVKYILNRG